jgi:hypothetical protein
MVAIVRRRVAIGPAGLACSTIGLCVYGFSAASVLLPRASAQVLPYTHINPEGTKR